MLSFIEQNIILYYADFLSLKHSSTHVTDNCKYYYIYSSPINLAYLVDSEPFYDENNPYYQQAYQEYMMLKNKVDQEGVASFVEKICNLAVMGCVDAELMLKQIHQFSNKSERSTAMKDYHNWISTQHYTHLTTNDQGDVVRTECTRYIAHYEQHTKADPQVYYDNGNTRRSKISNSFKQND